MAKLTKKTQRALIDVLQHLDTAHPKFKGPRELFDNPRMRIYLTTWVLPVLADLSGEPASFMTSHPGHESERFQIENSPVTGYAPVVEVQS